MSVLNKLRKKKQKNHRFVSQPLNFEHTAHFSALQIQGSLVEPEAKPAIEFQEIEADQDTKSLQRLVLSSDFQQTLRNIVKETLEAEIPKLLNEIKVLHYNPHVCADSSNTEVEPSTTETNLLQSVSVACQTEMNDEDSSASRNVQNDAQNKPQNGKPFPAPRLKLKQDSLETDDTSKTELRESTATSKHKFGPRAVLRMSKDDERECLSQALQANIVALVDRLQINLSSLPDQLISSGYMTEEECQMLRNDITSRKDQARYLVSRTKYRDLRDIENFLQMIENETPEVVAKIRAQFEENKRNNIKCTTCAICQCSNNIDIKDFVDILWSIRAISDSFYNEVIACAKPRGSQELLWKALVDICNSKQKKERQIIYGILFDFMLKKGNFEFIVKPLKGMLEKDGRIECRCHTSLKTSLQNRGSYGVLSSCSPRSSISEGRQSTFSFKSTMDMTEQPEIRLGREESLKSKRLERQVSINEETSTQ